MVIGVGGVVAAVLVIAVVSDLTGGNVTNGYVGPTSALVGTHVKGFTLDGLNGGQVKAPWESGRSSILVFFASYCGPCQVEMPKIAQVRSHA